MYVLVWYKATATSIRYTPICDCRYHKGPLFLVVQLRKDGFLSQVDMSKWEKLINTQQITSLLHYRGLPVFGYRRGICLLAIGN